MLPAVTIADANAASSPTVAATETSVPPAPSLKATNWLPA